VNVNNRISDIPPEFLGDFADRPITSIIDLLDTKTDIFRLMDELLTELHQHSGIALKTGGNKQEFL